MSDKPDLIGAAFLRNLQFENECSQTGKPCHDNCGCKLEMLGWVEEERRAVVGSPPGDK